MPPRMDRPKSPLCLRLGIGFANLARLFVLCPAKGRNMTDKLLQAQVQLTTNNQSDHSIDEIEMSWHLRWFLVYLYATALLLSIVAAVIVAIITKNVIPGFIPTPLLLSMKPIVNWAFSQRTS